MKLIIHHCMTICQQLLSIIDRWSIDHCKKKHLFTIVSPLTIHQSFTIIETFTMNSSSSNSSSLTISPCIHHQSTILKHLFTIYSPCLHHIINHHQTIIKSPLMYIGVPSFPMSFTIYSHHQLIQSPHLCARSHVTAAPTASFHPQHLRDLRRSFAPAGYTGRLPRK